MDKAHGAFLVRLSLRESGGFCAQMLAGLVRRTMKLAYALIRAVLDLFFRCTNDFDTK